MSQGTGADNIVVVQSQQQQQHNQDQRHGQHQYLNAAFQAPKPSNTRQRRASQQSVPVSASTASTTLTAKHGRQRSASLMAPSEMPQHLTKNYRELARDFRMLQPFTRLPDGTYPPETRCVFCEVATPTTVFFPCQHKCVCDVCIKLHSISSDHTRAGAWSACPVCMLDIRLMLPHSGNEENEYWRWIAEVKPSLPPSFKNEFKHAGKRLRRTNTVVPGGPMAAENTNDQQQQASAGARQPSNRRHTWQSPNSEQLKSVPASKSDHKTTCCIL